MAYPSAEATSSSPQGRIRCRFAPLSAERRADETEPSSLPDGRREKTMTKRTRRIRAKVRVVD